MRSLLQWQECFISITCTRIDNIVYRKPVIDTVCSRAFRRSVAILDPLHTSSCIPHAICDEAVLPFCGGDSQGEPTPYAEEYMDELVGEEFIPLERPTEPALLPKPPMDTGVGSDWAIPCRGSEGGRDNGEPPVICIWPICVIPVQRVSDGWNVKELSIDVKLPPKGERPVGGSRAPGVRNTFVVFFLFFHLARRFWNQTYTEGEKIDAFYYCVKHDASKLHAVYIHYSLQHAIIVVNLCEIAMTERASLCSGNLA